jgi:hypothetical protein
MSTPQNPLCPRCKIRRMHKNGPAQSGRKRWTCISRAGGKRVLCYKTTDPTAPVRDRNKPVAPDPIYKRELEPVSRFIITAAQNYTPIHRKFVASLLRAKRRLKAELLIIPIRYHNPTSVFSNRARKLDLVFPKVIERYLWSARKNLNPNLILLADIKVQPTASEPLMGYEAITHSESGILGHTKLQMKTVAAPSNRLPKILTTTGACTLPNYTDSSAGKKGEFHHTIGAVLVEIQGKTFHLRHLNAKSDGSFSDAGTGLTFRPDGISKMERPLALVMGDTHVDSIDPAVEAATFGKGGIIETLNPHTLVFHDLLDAYSCNPHHKNNPFMAYAKRQAGRDRIYGEIDRAVQFVVARTKGDRKSVIVASNHNDFVNRYMKDVDWREDPTNARFYLETALHLINNARIDQEGFHMPDPFGFWFAKLARGVSNARVLKRDESLALGGIELSMHGDIGPNGSRGSARNLRRVGVKSIIGHSHAPCINEGCYQVGTSTSLKLEYNIGPSAWLNTHCVLLANGKRQLISIIDGNWRM